MQIFEIMKSKTLQTSGIKDRRFVFLYQALEYNSHNFFRKHLKTKEKYLLVLKLMINK